MVEALAPVDVGFGVREFFQRVCEMGFVDVAKGHDILLCQPAVVGFCAAPDADQGDVELVIGGTSARDDAGREDRDTGADKCRLSEEIASIHGIPSDGELVVYGSGVATLSPRFIGLGKWVLPRA